MTTISTGTKLTNTVQNPNNAEQKATSPIQRLITAIATIPIEWGLEQLHTKSILITIMLFCLNIVLLVLFLLCTIDVFYILRKGKTLFDDIFHLDLRGLFTKEEEDDSKYFFNSDPEELKRQFSSLEMVKSPHGKEKFKIVGSTDRALTIEEIKADMVTATHHVKERGPGKGGLNVFNKLKWTYYYTTASQMLKERKEFFETGTHRIFLKNKSGEAIIIEGAYQPALDGAKEYIKEGFCSNEMVQCYHFPQAEKSNEFRQIEYNTIYEAEKIDYHTETIVKNTFGIY